MRPLAAAAAVGYGVWVVYGFVATFEILACANIFSDGPQPAEHLEGSHYSSVEAAALLGIVLWLGFAIAITRPRLRRSWLLLVVVYEVLYLVALVGLWTLAPAIWGPEHCVPD